MIGVAHVLEIKLPIVVQNLRRGAENLRGPVHDAVNARADQIADIVAEWRGVGRHRTENEVAELLDPELLQPVLLEAEARRHAALTGDAAPKGDAVEIAFEVVAPGVVDAGQIVGMASPL